MKRAVSDRKKMSKKGGAPRRLPQLDSKSASQDAPLKAEIPNKADPPLHLQAPAGDEERKLPEGVVEVQKGLNEAKLVMKEDPVTKVLMLYVGGTIGMKKTERGYTPTHNFMKQKLSTLPQFHDASKPELTTPLSRFGKRVHYHIKEYSPLLDSSNATPNDWINMASDIYRNYNKYDAFIILHGTDTMVYTASALSFMLENLSKTVIITGSQIPLSVEPNDAVDNLMGAIIIAGHYEIPEVCIFFAGKLYRGNRCVKISATDLDAFNSPNFPPLIEMGVNINVHWHLMLAAPAEKKLNLRTTFDPNVGVLKLFPGITARTIENFMLPPLKGCILETYGSGNAPDNRKDFLAALKAATDRGVVIVNVTQCLKGLVECNYATGRALVEAGVISGYDLTTECALAKLSFLLGKGLKTQEVREEMMKSLAGELTIPEQHRFSFRDKTFSKIISAALKSYKGLSEIEIREVEKVLYPVLLCTAAGNGDLEEVKKIISNGADKNGADYDKRTPLHLAACEGKLEVVKYLVDIGANPNPVDRWGRTPLAEAHSHGHEAVAKYLEAHGALREFDVKFLVQRATSQGNLEELSRLYNKRFNEEPVDQTGKTLLHIACAEGHRPVVEFLISKGASPTVEDKAGETPLQVALDRGHFEIATLLARSDQLKKRKNSL